MSYSINLSGHSEDQDAVRTAFGSFIAALKAVGTVSGQLSDQSGGIDVPDEPEAASEAPVTDEEPTDPQVTASLDPDSEATDETPVDPATIVATEPVVADANDPDNPLNNPTTQ